MSVITSVIENTLNTAMTMGKAVLHAKAPDNYEYYMCSLELIDCSGNQVGFISFVVMPNNITESATPIQTQTKTKNGMVTLFNDSFAPVNISLQGTFGRKFKIVTDMVDPSESKKNFFNGSIGKISGVDAAVKSGYGLTRVLQYILKKTNKLDAQGRPYILLFNNYSFNSSYVVDVMSYSFNQSIENNMLWFYELQLKAIAPGSAVRNSKQNNAKLLKVISSNAIAQGLTNVINDVKRNNILKYV